MTPHEIIASTLPGLGSKTNTRDGCVYALFAEPLAAYGATVRMTVHDGHLVATTRVAHPRTGPKSRQRIFRANAGPHVADVIKQDIRILTAQIVAELGGDAAAPELPGIDG